MNLKTAEPTPFNSVSPRIKVRSRFAGSLFDWLASLGLAAFLFLAQSNVALAATAPSLGAAAPYGIASTTLTNGTVSSTDGRVCYTGAGPATPWVSAGADSPCAPQVGLDQAAALANLNLQACTPISGTLDAVVIGANPPGTFPPGCYSNAGAFNITANTTVTLTGNGVFIFKSGGVTTGGNSHVNVTGGACADNVFWAQTAAVNLGAAASTFVGNILDPAGITMGNTAKLIGRALSFGVTVTTDTNTITLPTACPPVGGSVSAAPTLSQWAMIILTGLLAIGGFVAMRRRQRPSARRL